MDAKDLNFNGFKDAIKYLKEQTLKPVVHPTFWYYFIVAILGFGALGIWYELRHIKDENYLNLIAALILFCPPLISNAYFQLALNKQPNTSAKAVFGLICVIGIYICFELISIENKSESLMIYLGIPFAICLTIWVTWLQSSLNEDLYDKPAEKAAIGGKKVDTKLNGNIPTEYES